MNLRYIGFVIVLFVMTNQGFSQNKKAQITILNSRVDSLISDGYQKSKAYQLEIEKLESVISDIKNERSILQLKVEEDKKLLSACKESILKMESDVDSISLELNNQSQKIASLRQKCKVRTLDSLLRINELFQNFKNTDDFKHEMWSNPKTEFIEMISGNWYYNVNSDVMGDQWSIQISKDGKEFTDNEKGYPNTINIDVIRFYDSGIASLSLRNYTMDFLLFHAFDNLYIC